jgi:thiol-disulfide isomerase/thioredoxin
MPNFKILLKSIFLIGICFVSLSYAHADNDLLPSPKIHEGIAKVSGKVINFHPKSGEGNPVLTMYIPNPITAEPGKFETHLSEDGSFDFEVPIECSTTLGCIVSDIYNGSVSVFLASDEDTKLEITYEETGNIKTIMSDRPELTSNDIINSVGVLGNIRSYHLPESKPLYSMKLVDFVPHEIGRMESRLQLVANDSTLSKSAKNYISNEYKLTFLKTVLLDYKINMLVDYNRCLKPNGGPDNFTPQEPNKSYYAFLKYFNLNDPQYLYNASLTEVLQTILSNEILNIPKINDTLIQDWLKEVKTTLAELMGSDTGLFYDLLAANAYSRQFNNEQKPLSDKQKENIKSYFKDEEITKIILKKNEMIIKLDEEKQHFQTIINATPDVPKEALMNAIVSKYKGKVVVVDFWATWCASCLDAMKEYRKVKNELKGKDVVFVYITNVSSPKKLWKEKIKIIGSEQYYLNKEEWVYLFDSIGFNAIPTYLFYDKNGMLKNKVTAYPGSEKMLKTIENLLQ